jgi:hypothetical protein
MVRFVARSWRTRAKNNNPTFIRLWSITFVPYVRSNSRDHIGVSGLSRRCSIARIPPPFLPSVPSRPGARETYVIEWMIACKLSDISRDIFPSRSIRRRILLRLQSSCAARAIALQMRFGRSVTLNFIQSLFGSKPI